MSALTRRDVLVIGGAVVLTPSIATATKTVVSGSERHILVVDVDNRFMSSMKGNALPQGQKLITDLSVNSAMQPVPAAIIFARAKEVALLRKQIEGSANVVELFGVAAKVVGCGVVDWRPRSDYVAVLRVDNPMVAPSTHKLTGANRPGAIRILGAEEWQPRAA